MLATHALAGPSIDNLVPLASFQIWNLVEIGAHGPGVAKCIHHCHNCTFGRFTRPVFSGIGCVKSPIWIHSPPVRRSRSTVDGILVESEETPILQDVDICLS